MAGKAKKLAFMKMCSLHVLLEEKFPYHGYQYQCYHNHCW